MSQSVLSVRMDDEVKEAFSQFCEEAGLSVSAAVNVFARQTIRDQAIPFSISLKSDPVAPLTSVTPYGSKASAILSLATIREVVTQVTSRYPAIDRVTLFGSYARGEASSQSDVDIRILCDPVGKFSLFDLSGYGYDLEMALGKRIDIVSSRELHDRVFEQEIERDGVLLYERESK